VTTGRLHHKVRAMIMSRFSTSRRAAFVVALALAAGGLTACQKGGGKSDDKAKTDQPNDGKATTANAKDGGTTPPGRRPVEAVPPPLPVAAPPPDATKTASGISYKVLQEPPATTPDGKPNAAPGKNDTVVVNYTGWKTSGETYYTTKSRGKPQPMSLASTAPGWTEALSLMKIGERAMFWIPPELAFKGKPRGQAETLVFEIELVSIEPAPPVPDDVAAAPADATKTPSGLAYKLLAKGTGTDKPRLYDNAMINYTAWDSTGRMFDSTVVRKRPRPALLFKEMPGLAEGLATMQVGEKKRFWIPAELTKSGPNLPAGTLVYDVELVEVKRNPEPPATPKDVAAPPKDAKKTEKGVSYKVLKPGKGDAHPATTDTVVVEYTGWTTDGKMFDSSVIRGQPARFPLNGVIPGWTDGLQVMKVGESTRFWIPEELAYKGAPGRPAGMLVFDVTLKEIVAGGAQPPGGRPHGMPPGMDDGHGHGQPGGMPGSLPGHGQPPARVPAPPRTAPPGSPGAQPPAATTPAPTK
jgi:FKBP-type peptidyl-prolyl cis-trans isomerase